MSKTLQNAGHRVLKHDIIKDDFTKIQEYILLADQDKEVEALLINGGTGLALRDTTFEAVKHMLDKEISGFGELFRYLSYELDIGPAAMLSRATAGIRGCTAIFSTPGSSGAVQLAMEKLIIPELPHLMREIYKDRK
jgi:molybdenum cofactor biosynthesis protein B